MEQAYRAEVTVSEDGSVSLKGLPFRPGELVEVIVLTRGLPVRERAPLRGSVRRYTDPTEPVAGEDWDLAS